MSTYAKVSREFKWFLIAQFSHLTFEDSFEEDVTNTGNGERGTGNRERESGNECTAVTRLRIQNGGQNKRKGPKNQQKKQFKT